MSKKWDVKIDDQMYNLELKGKKLTINGETLKLNKYKKKTGLIHEEYEVPVGSKTALLVIRSMSAPQLVIDNKDCATGEEYVPIKLPVWSYVFVVLHCINFINGAIGCGIAVIGIALTTSVSCNKKFSVIVKVLLDLAILVLAYAVVFGVAFLASGLTA